MEITCKNCGIPMRLMQGMLLINDVLIYSTYFGCHECGSTLFDKAQSLYVANQLDVANKSDKICHVMTPVRVVRVIK